MIEIPLTSDPEQLFNITIEGENFDIRVILNSRTSVWSINFSQAGVDLIEGVPLLGGVDILKQHNLPISNIFLVNLDDSNLDPDKTNLGTAARLFILEDEEVPT